MNILEAFKNKINELSANQKVKNLYVFGIILTSQFKRKKDINLIVDFMDINVKDNVDSYFDFKFSLFDLLNRPFDLFDEQTIKYPYFN